ncbi:helix-turn-helix domain-containing protein, partial [Roseisolibacter sp. H3M3-2]|uniref:helix-turn-helix domain-containing protein n=1 Tax=Roseisolibacter sp. H3M3-2 TaxID=3031323 RepID=UPI0023DA5FE7
DGADPRVRGALHLLDGTAADAPATARLCREVAVSRRTLERLFAEQIGLAPRSYARLRRVGAVARALERDTPERARSLSELAHGLGYSDHAHMTREFVRVMGVTPSGYRREALAAPVARRPEGGVVAQERPTPLGTVGATSVVGA